MKVGWAPPHHAYLRPLLSVGGAHHTRLSISVGRGERGLMANYEDEITVGMK